MEWVDVLVGAVERKKGALSHSDRRLGDKGHHRAASDIYLTSSTLERSFNM
jgi:hypothetical protein